MAAVTLQGAITKSRQLTGVWTNFEPMEHNLLSLSTLDPISPTHSGMVEMGSNVLKAKILHSISPKLVQTPDTLQNKYSALNPNEMRFPSRQKTNV